MVGLQIHASSYSSRSSRLILDILKECFIPSSKVPAPKKQAKMSFGKFIFWIEGGNDKRIWRSHTFGRTMNDHFF